MAQTFEKIPDGSVAAVIRHRSAHERADTSILNERYKLWTTGRTTRSGGGIAGSSCGRRAAAARPPPRRAVGRGAGPRGGPVRGGWSWGKRHRGEDRSASRDLSPRGGVSPLGR